MHRLYVVVLLVVWRKRVHENLFELWCLNMLCCDLRFSETDAKLLQTQVLLHWQAEWRCRN